MLMSVPGGNSGFEVVEGCQARRILNLLLIHNLEKYGEAPTSTENTTLRKRNNWTYKDTGQL